MRTFCFAYLLSVIVVATAMGGSPELNPNLLFEKGNSAYREKKYDEAITAYEKILEQGFRSDVVYYNLANAYFKDNNLSKAILNYERAKKLNPLDEEINFNLRLAYAATADKIEPLPLLFYERWWKSFVTKLTPTQWSYFAIGCVWLSLVAGIAYLFARTVAFKRNAFLVMVGLLPVAGFFYISAYSADSSFNGKKAAIIIDSNAAIKSSPDIKSTTLFILHEGTRVEITDEMQNWMEIKIANGNVGWIESAKTESI